MSIAKKICVSTLCALGLLILSLGFLLGTNSGLQIVKGTLEKTVYGLTIETVSGSFFHLNASGLRYQTAGLSFQGNLTWNLNVADLLRQRIEIAEIELSQAQIQIRAREEDASKSNLNDAPSQEPSPSGSRLKTPLAISLSNLTVKDTEIDVNGNRFVVGLFNAKALWQKDHIVVESARMADSHFEQAPNTPSNVALGVLLKQTFSQPVLPAIEAIHIPVDISVQNFDICNFAVNHNSDLHIDSLQFALEAKNNQLTVTHLALRTPKVTLNADFVLGLDAQHQIDLTSKISAVVPREIIPTGAVAPIEEPSVDEIETFYERLKQARAERLKAIKERRTNNQTKAKSHSSAQKKTLSPEQQRQLNRKIGLRLKKRIERWRESVRGMIPSQAPLPPVTVTLNARLQGALASALTLTGTFENIPGVRDSSFSISATPTQPGLPISAHVEALDVQIAGATFTSPRIDFVGKAVDYSISSASRISYPLDSNHNFTSEISAAGKGTETRVHLNKITINSNIGLIDLEAEADWSNELFFSTALDLSHIDTSSITPQSPLKVNGGFSCWGTLKNGYWQTSLQDLTVMGELRGNPLTLSASMSSNGGGLVEIPSLFVAIGNNTFDLSGQADVSKSLPKLDFKAKIDAPSLAILDPNLHGTIKGTMAVTGSTSLPVINADITARNIAYAGTRLNSARLNGRMRSRDTVSGNITLELEGLVLDGVSVSKATLRAQGSELRHQITIRSEGSPVAIQAKINGLYERMLGNWTGSLAEFEIQNTHGSITLDKPMRLTYVSALKRLNVMTACLKHSDAKICLKNNLRIDLTNQSDLHVLLELEKFDLAFLERYFQKRFGAEGIVTAQLDLTLPAGLSDLPSGKLSIQANNTRATYPMQSKDFQVDFDRIDLLVSNTKNSVSAQWNVELKNNGSIKGNLHIGDVFHTRTLSGTLKLIALDTTLINSSLAPGESAEGEIHGNIRFAGTIEEPLLYGEGGIRNMRLDSTKLPFEMLPSDLALQFDGNSSSLDGFLKTPKGEVHLEGKADWRTLDEAQALITAKGKNLRMTLPPTAEFDLTTNIRCEANAQRIKLDGYIGVPWARVKVTELPASAIAVSEDVIRTDRPRIQKASDQRQPIVIESNLFINIGENVRVEALGLRARLTGKLSVIQNKGALGLTGQISVPNGNFKAYGQELIVRHGEFHFAGPAANPSIDLEAIRNPENTADGVIAGVRVGGTADVPQVSIFTDPAKSDTEALSYLIRGEGLDPSGDSDNTMITSALINLGLSQGSQAFKSLGDAIGISGLGLDTEGVGDSSQLVVSGYVLPGLKVKYGVGLFDSLATLTLRYRVIPKLYIEAVSGVDQALDLLYAFEF